MDFHTARVDVTGHTYGGSRRKVMNFRNQLILAPMVRGSKLPMRLLALKYGAGLVYTDEIIDISLLTAKRFVNDILGTVDYVNEANGYVLFRTAPVEKDRLVFQMGTSNPSRAVQLAKFVEADVSAIDVNMGCPKPYSCDFGMGAALLRKPDRAKEILKALVQNVQVPVTCKIRILPDIEDSVKMVKDFESVGVSAIAVHGRLRHQTSNEPVNKDAIRRIVESVRIPVIANGASNEVESYADIERFRDECGATSVMIARAAQKNVSIFREEGLLDPEVVIPEYLKICIDYDNSVSNTKYSLEKICKMNGEKIQRKKFAKEFDDATKMVDICRLWDLGGYCASKHKEYEAQGHLFLPCSPAKRSEDIPAQIVEFRKALYNDDHIILSMMKFQRKFFSHDTLPKMHLNNYATKHGQPRPVYHTRRENRLHYSVIEFMGKRYSSLIWNREKKIAEQNAALVCLHRLGFYEEPYLIAIGCLKEALETEDVYEAQFD